MYSELSWEFEVNVGMHQRFVLSPILFVVVVGNANDMPRDGVLS